MIDRCDIIQLTAAMFCGAWDYETGLDGSEETSNLGSYHNSSGVGFEPMRGGAEPSLPATENEV